MKTTYAWFVNGPKYDEKFLLRFMKRETLVKVVNFYRRIFSTKPFMKIGRVDVYHNGNRYWYLDDRLHRVNGPAVELADGFKEWYLYDRRVTEAEHKRLTNPLSEEA